MTQQESTEQRLSALEARMAALESSKREQEDRDIALLARVDGFIDDLRRIERVQMRGFDELRADHNDLHAEFRAHQEYMGERFDTIENHLNVRIDVIEDNLTARLDEQRVAIQTLQAGQQQILDILQSKLKTND
jgi:hypothetical protein